MEGYKALNSELIGKVQEMKMCIAEYQKEIVQLRKQYMEEHGIRLEMEQRLLGVLACNFRKAVKEIDANVDILQLLTDEGGSGGESGVGNFARSSTVGREVTSERRSSANFLVRELRRSIAVQQRRSVRRSPAKRQSSSGTSLVSPREVVHTNCGLESEDAMNEKEYEDTELQPDDNAECMLKQKEGYRYTLENIYEYMEPEPEDEEKTAIEVLQSPASKNSSKRSKVRYPLRDLSNRKSKSPEKAASPEPSYVHVVMQRGKRRKTQPHDSIEGARFLPSFRGQCLDCEPTPPAQESNNTDDSRNENTFTRSPSSLTMSYTKFGNVASAPCSTPCYLSPKENTPRRQTLRSQKKLTNTSNNQSSNSITNVKGENTTNTCTFTLMSASASCSNSTRAQRKCKPKNLTEPSLMKKMRCNTSRKKK